MSSEKVLCSWRVLGCEPSGLLVWFDPHTEHLRLFQGPHPDSEKVPDGRIQLDEEGAPGYLDKVGSVSESEPEPEPYVPGRDEQIGLLEELSDLPF